VEVEKMVLYHKKQVYQEDQGVELVIQVLQVQVVLEEQETVHLQVHHKEIQEEIHQMHRLDQVQEVEEQVLPEQFHLQELVVMEEQVQQIQLQIHQ
jgi:hypothetical protein